MVQEYMQFEKQRSTMGTSMPAQGVTESKGRGELGK